MSKHAPGPWEFDHGFGMIYDCNGLPVVAELAGPTPHHNARLISAAPDMAEALRTIVELHLSGTEMRIAAEDPAFVAGRWLEAMEAARAALKKAGIQ